MMQCAVHLTPSSCPSTQILMENGPSGAYHLTCKKCHMDPKFPKVLLCHCQGLDGQYDLSKLDDAENCMNIDNLNGYLQCGDKGWGKMHQVHPPPPPPKSRIYPYDE